MKYLVTGVAGFIGMHLAIRLLKEGHEVVGIDNLNDYYSLSLKLARLDNIQNQTEPKDYSRFRFEKIDLSDLTNSSFLCDRFDGLFHLAAQAGVRYSLENPMQYIQSNIIGFQRIIDFVVKNEIKYFFYASSSSVYGRSSEVPFREDMICNSPESLYAATKMSNELVASSYFNTHGVTSVGLRFFTVYGPWGRPDMAPMIFTKAALGNEPIELFNYGKQYRDFTYIDDIIEGIVLLSRQTFLEGAHIFNIGNGEPVLLFDFVSLIEEKLNRKLNVSLKPAQPGDVDRTSADVKKLYSITKFKPSVSLTYGLDRFLKWYLDYNQILSNLDQK